MRVKESEIQYLKQEISSLKDELQTALRVRAKGVEAGQRGVKAERSDQVLLGSLFHGRTLYKIAVLKSGSLKIPASEHMPQK